MDDPIRPSATTSSLLAEWFTTPLGRYQLEREQGYFDRTVADIFGFHAIQIGLPACPFLAQSRIAARWTLDLQPPAQVLADPQWLPFPENSLDLIVLPHALEFTSEPHQLLREVYRAVRPEGQVVIAGFNPFSLFGAKRYFGRGELPPWNGNFIALYRLKDWLALLGFDVSAGRLAGYVPPFDNQRMRHRFRFMELAGDRWWAVGGAVYMLQAVKRVRGMRLITPAWQEKSAREKALIAAAKRQGAATARPEDVMSASKPAAHLRIVK